MELFLSQENVRKISEYLQRDAYQEMKQWRARQGEFDSVFYDNTQTLDYMNSLFCKEYRRPRVEKNITPGRDFPKFFIEEGVENYTPDDFRAHDAYFDQKVFRTNENFRYGNKIKSWRIGQHARHYDRASHAEGLRDLELGNINRGYNMDKIYNRNPFVSSDTLFYS